MQDADAILKLAFYRRTDETLGGLVMARLGRVPVVGDVVRLDAEYEGGTVTATVEEMDGRRVDRLRLRTGDTA